VLKRWLEHIVDALCNHILAGTEAEG